MPVQLRFSANDRVIFEEISIQETVIDQLKIDRIIAEALDIIDKSRRKRDLTMFSGGTGMIGVQILQLVGVAVRVFEIAVRRMF